MWDGMGDASRIVQSTGSVAQMENGTSAAAAAPDTHSTYAPTTFNGRHKVSGLTPSSMHTSASIVLVPTTMSRERLTHTHTPHAGVDVGGAC